MFVNAKAVMVQNDSRISCQRLVHVSSTFTVKIQSVVRTVLVMREFMIRVRACLLQRLVRGYMTRVLFTIFIDVLHKFRVLFERVCKFRK